MLLMRAASTAKAARADVLRASRAASAVLTAADPRVRAALTAARVPPLPPRKEATTNVNA